MAIPPRLLTSVRLTVIWCWLVSLGISGPAHAQQIGTRQAGTRQAGTPRAGNQRAGNPQGGTDPSTSQLSPQFRAAVAHVAINSPEDGDEDAYLTAFWENSAVTPIQQNGFHVIPAAIVRAAEPELASCLQSEPCLRRLAARLHTPTVFLIESEGGRRRSAFLTVVTVTATEIHRTDPESLTMNNSLVRQISAVASETAARERPCELVLPESSETDRQTLPALSLELDGTVLEPAIIAAGVLFLKPGERQLSWSRGERQAPLQPVACVAGERWQVVVE